MSRLESVRVDSVWNQQTIDTRLDGVYHLDFTLRFCNYLVGGSQYLPDQGCDQEVNRLVTSLESGDVGAANTQNVAKPGESSQRQRNRAGWNSAPCETEIVRFLSVQL